MRAPSDAAFARAEWLAVMVRTALASRIAVGALLAVTYTVTARLSLAFVLVPEQIATIWPPAGVALAALLLRPRREWPALLAGVAVAVFAANVAAGVSLAPALGFVAANTLEPLAAAVVLERVLGRSIDIRRVVDVVAFAIIAVGAAAVSALLGGGAAVVSAGAASSFASTWLTWWLADSAGILAVTPLALVVPSLLRRPRSTLPRLLEMGLLQAGVGVFCAFVLLGPAHHRPFPAFLLLAWAGVRTGMAGTSLLLAEIAIVASAGAAVGLGPFAHPDAPGLAVREAQAFIGILFVTSYLIAASVQEHRDAHRELEVRRVEEASHAERLDAGVRFARRLGMALDGSSFDLHLAEAVRDTVTLDWLLLVIRQGDGTWVVTAGVGTPHAIGERIEPRGVLARAITASELAVASSDEPGELVFGAGIEHPAGGPVAALPLVHDGRPVAVLLLGRQGGGRPFEAGDRRLLELMADLGSIAIRNSRTLADATERSARDPLTGLPNRRAFDVALTQFCAQRSREAPDDRTEVAVLFFDLDHFGAVNKQRGHAVGDGVLRTFAGLLSTRLRAGDIVARYGGEEFVAVLPGTDRAQGIEVASEIRESFADLRQLGEDGEPIRCTVSAGVAALEDGEDDPEHALRRADVALAMAKRAGRDQVQAA